MLLHEEKKFLRAFPDLEGADFTAGKPVQLLQDYALNHQHHFKEVVLERDVDAQHARLGGEAKELRFVGHGIDRHGGGGKPVREGTERQGPGQTGLAVGGKAEPAAEGKPVPTGGPAQPRPPPPLPEAPGPLLPLECRRPRLVTEAGAAAGAGAAAAATALAPAAASRLVRTPSGGQPRQQPISGREDKGAAQSSSAPALGGGESEGSQLPPSLLGQ